MPAAVLKEGEEGAVAAAGVEDDGIRGEMLKKTGYGGIEILVAGRGICSCVLVRDACHGDHDNCDVKWYGSGRRWNSFAVVVRLKLRRNSFIGMGVQEFSRRESAAGGAGWSRLGEGCRWRVRPRRLLRPRGR